MSGSHGRLLSRIQSSNHSRRNCRRVATISSYGPGWAGQARPGLRNATGQHRARGNVLVRTQDADAFGLCIERPSASAFGRMAKQPWGECLECASRCNFLSRLPRSDESRPSLYIARWRCVPGAILRDTRVATLQFRASLGPPLACNSYRCEMRSIVFHGRNLSLILDFVEKRNSGTEREKMYFSGVLDGQISP